MGFSFFCDAKKFTGQQYHKIKFGITVYKNEVKSLMSKFYCCKNLGMLNLKNTFASDSWCWERLTPCI